MEQDKLSNSLLRVVNSCYELLGLIDIENNTLEILYNTRNLWNFEQKCSYESAFCRFLQSISNDIQKKNFSENFSLDALRMAAANHSTFPQSSQIQIHQMKHEERFHIIRFNLCDIEGMCNTFLFAVQSVTDEKADLLEYETMHATLRSYFDFILSVTASSGKCKCLYHSSQISFPISDSVTSYTDFVNHIIAHIHPNDLEEFNDFITLSHVIEKLKNQDTIQTNFRYEDGNHHIWYELTICRFYRELNDSIRFLILLQNITTQKEEEKKHLAELSWALQNAEKANITQHDFINNVAREIRTPLNGIFSMTNLLLKEKDLTHAKIAKYTNIINDSSNYLLKIINALLDFSALASNTFDFNEEAYTIKKLLTDIQNDIDIQKYKKINYTFETDEMLPSSLYGDVLHLSQAIINIINNAFQYTPDGNITVNVHWENLGAGEGNLCVDVTDTGIGIKEKNLEDIFQVFWHDHEKSNIGTCGGIGMGLTIAKMIIENMGGSLTLESEYGKGSAFHIIVPQTVLDEQPFGTLLEHEDALYEKHIGDIADKHFLIIDDSPMNLEVMEVIMDELGARTTLCQNGREAINLLEHGNVYDIIFMDHFMPELDGIETTHLIRKIPSDYCQSVPIIAFTANSASNARKMYIEQGMNDILLKPIDIKTLKKILKKWLS